MRRHPLHLSATDDGYELGIKKVFVMHIHEFAEAARKRYIPWWIDSLFSPNDNLVCAAVSIDEEDAKCRRRMERCFGIAAFSLIIWIESVVLGDRLGFGNRPDLQFTFPALLLDLLMAGGFSGVMWGTILGFLTFSPDCHQLRRAWGARVQVLCDETEALLATLGCTMEELPKNISKLRQTARNIAVDKEADTLVKKAQADHAEGEERTAFLGAHLLLCQANDRMKANFRYFGLFPTEKDWASIRSEAEPVAVEKLAALDAAEKKGQPLPTAA